MSEGGIIVSVAVVVVFLLAAAFYFVPSIVAIARKVPSTGSVVVVNIFLGWTLIGWVVALAMAARSRPQPMAPPVPSWGQSGPAPRPAPEQVRPHPHGELTPPSSPRGGDDSEDPPART